MTDTVTEALDLTAHRGTDSMMQHPCSPGSHPHSNRPNWEPAETANDYLRNCRDGLEAYSDRRMAKLLGWSRAHLWRAKLMAEIPEDLFDRSVARDRPMTRSAAHTVARFCGFAGGGERVRKKS